jgi:hypothetical protein
MLQKPATKGNKQQTQLKDNQHKEKRKRRKCNFNIMRISRH